MLRTLVKQQQNWALKAKWTLEISASQYNLKSAVSGHAKNAGHSINGASVKIIGQENHLLSCKICEAINIHTQQLEMNHDQGYNLLPLYGTICSLIH